MLLENLEQKPVIYIADDEEANLFIMKATFRDEPYELRTFRTGQELITLLEKGDCPPDLVLLDIMMPDMDGYEVCRQIRRSPTHKRIPVVMVTGLDGVDHIVAGLDAGADDYITKPFHPLEVRARVRSLMRIKFMGDRLEETNLALSDQKLLLEGQVRDRTQELEDITVGVVSSLEKANALNDSDTGNHIMRVCAYSELLALAMKLPGEQILKIRRYASLHDVGKVGIPDDLLKKPGELTSEEFESMKRHTVMGYEMLELARADVMAKNIALCHHEKFNGKGYPLGLKGYDIPLEARIVALADVFDALTTKRVYKNAYPLPMARQIIEEQRGEHFDPLLVDTHLENWDVVVAIMQRYEDGPPTVQFTRGDNLPPHPKSPLDDWEATRIAQLREEQAS